MNQILNTPRKSNNSFYKAQFIISIFITICLIIYAFNNFFNLLQQEKLSNQVVNNYSLSQLYATSSKKARNNNLFGIIEIPKINVYYPVFSNLNDELLKIAPCKFYGNFPNKNENICIAGHNYNNNLFFGNIYKLNTNDEIILYDYSGIQYVYHVYSIFEVNSTDVLSVVENTNNEKLLTLVTCNNLNNNRIIVKSKQKGS